MRTRAVIVAALLLAACDGDAPGVDAAGTLPPAPIGGGFCCPIEGQTCDCHRNGGWTDVNDVATCPGICDQAPDTTTAPDLHGCDQQTSPHSCLDPH